MHTLKKIMVSLIIASACFSSAVAYADTKNDTYTWSAAEEVENNGDFSYLPLRSIMKHYAIDVTWVQEKENKILLSNNNETFQIVVDGDQHVVHTEAGDFSYSNRNGSFSFSPSFYKTIFGNANVTWNSTEKTLSVQPLDEKGITIRNLSAYVEEPAEQARFYEHGDATWYGSGAMGNLTASGEPFNMYDLTAAHKYLPFGTRVKVTNLTNGASVVVRINDRGPFGAGRVIDLSYAAAGQIGLISAGVAPVQIDILS